jgi:hypothetical protein
VQDSRHATVDAHHQTNQRIPSDMDTKQLNSELQYGDAAEDRKLCLYFQRFVHQHTLPRFFKDLTVNSSSLLEAQPFKLMLHLS